MKKNKKGWPYSSNAPENKKWQKDRQELFAEGGNGWWYFTGFPELMKEHLKNTKKNIEL